MLKIVDVEGKGVVKGEVKFPTSAVTCPCFVGRELVVTTADDGRGGAAGAVFRVDVEVGGLRDFEFRLERGV